MHANRSVGTVLVAFIVVAGICGCQTPDVGKYGFRVDPMKWVNSSTSVAAAQVRTFLLKMPQSGDKAILQAEINRLLAMQREDGSLGEDQTVGVLIRLERLGCDPNRKEVQRAIKYLVKREKASKTGLLGVYELHVVRWAKWPEVDLIKRSTEALAKEVQTMNFWSLCPWGGQVHTHGLWAGREYADIKPALDRGMRVMADSIKEGRGWPDYLDPFGYLDAAGNIDHPLARQMVIKELPLILRSQLSDGSWGGKKHLGYGPDDTTYIVLRALIKWNLLDELRRRPPLPKDWRIVRSVPAPQGDLSKLTYAGGRLWVHEKTKGEIVGISRKDGKADRRLKPPWVVANIGNVNGKLGVVHIKRDKSGRGTETLWVTDPDRVGPLQEIPMNKWRGADGPWHVLDFYDGPKVIAKNGGRDGWGDAPFGEHTTGVTWDRKELWALDNAAKRICSIERSPDSTLEPIPLGDQGFIRKWLVCGPLPSPALSENALAKVIAAQKGNENAKHLRGGHNVDYLKAAGGEAAARPKEGQTVKLPDGSIVKWQTHEALGDKIWLHEIFGEEPGHGPMVAYAFTTIYRAKAGKAFLAVGTDDNAKVYLNGKLVRDAYIARPMEVDEDVIPVEFKQGENTLLIKVENVKGGGGFIIRPVRRLPTGQLKGLPPDKP